MVLKSFLLNTDSEYKPNLISDLIFHCTLENIEDDEMRNEVKALFEMKRDSYVDMIDANIVRKEGIANDMRNIKEALEKYVMVTDFDVKKAYVSFLLEYIASLFIIVIGFVFLFVYVT